MTGNKNERCCTTLPSGRAVRALSGSGAFAWSDRQAWDGQQPQIQTLTLFTVVNEDYYSVLLFNKIQLYSLTVTPRAFIVGYYFFLGLIFQAE